MDSAEDLYIKMNSRGKPLTPFENFKARFEHDIASAGDRRLFAHKIDGSWSDLLWRLHGGDNIVDDKFLRYFEFITDICQWRAGQLPGGARPETRALQLFGTAGRQAEENLEFLFHAFDTWAGADIGGEFRQLFATNRADLARDPDRLLLFGTETGTDLFEACCPVLRHSAVHLRPHTSPVCGAPGPRQPLRGLPAAAKGAAQLDRGVGERAPSAPASRASRRRAAHRRARLTRRNQRLQ